MRRKIAATIAGAMLVTLLAGTKIAAAGVGQPLFYVSLGDSAAAGVQPPGFTAMGYADQLALKVRRDNPQLRLVKLGCPGETTASLITGVDSPCAYPAGSQLDEAAAVLRTNPGRIAFVTINVGVNDVLDACFADSGLIDPACVAAHLPPVLANLATIIRTVRAAAPGVPIAGMSYWNPFLGFWVIASDGELLARTADRSMRALNAGLVSTYQHEGAMVADVAGAFNIADFDTIVRTRWGMVPANVATACKWTWFCQTPPLGPDPHPTTRGYGVIADALAAVLGV
jgi:lysophospholipase L1-like esterase